MLTKHQTWKKLLAFCLIGMLFFSAVPSAGADTALASAPLTRGATQNGMVRVRLSSLGNPSSLKLTVNGSYTVNGKTSKAISSGAVLQVGFSSTTGKLTLTHNGTTTNMGTTFKLRRHATDGSNGIKIAQGRVPNNLYPGDFEFIVRKNSTGYTLYVIVHVYIEDYLYGVLPYEMGNSSGLEALKAQAVTARTYTMRAMSASTSSLYDVVDTPSDQVYSGTPSGNANCKAAVDGTKGIVAKNGSAFTATYYSASNGGQTESIKNAWGSNSYTYLKVKDDPYDLANPASRKNSFTVNAAGTQPNATLQSLLNNKASAKFGTGATVNGVSAIQLHTSKYASPSKLYTKADFTVRYTRNGISNTGTITFDIFNELEAPLGMSINSGSNELWSVEETASGFTVYARRYGHGLGMSQRGAMYMAQLGYTYDQILAFYFEGCSRVQYTFTRSILSAVIDGEDSSEETIVEQPADIEQDAAHIALVALANGTALLSDASSSANVMTTLPQGAKVNVAARSGDYYLVAYGSLCGYVAASSLDHDGTVSGESVSPTRLYGYGTVVNSNALNLRSAPSMTGSNVYTTIPGKTVLPVFSVTGNWAYVQYGLRVGYVSLDYISMLSAAPVQPQATASPVPSQTLKRARVTTEKGSLNLRKSTSSTAKVLCTIPQYAVIDVYEVLGDWCRVKYSSHEGYVMSKFLTFITDSATGTPAPSATNAPSYGNTVQYARVTTAKGSLNLRVNASSTARVLRTIPQYAVIEVHQNDGSWCYVTYEGTSGYVMRSFLTFLASAPTVQPTFVPATATPVPVTPIPQATQAPAAPGAQYARVTTLQGSLNLRETENGRVLRTIPQYAVVQVLDKGNTWCEVLYEGTVGYVMTKFITFIQVNVTPTAAPVLPSSPTQAPVATQTPQQSSLTATVNTAQGSLNLRAIPEGRVLRTVPQYATVTVLTKGASWCYISYQGTEGYVMTKFLSFHQTQPSATAAPAPTQAPVVSRPTQAPVQEYIECYAIVMTDKGSLNLRKTAYSDAKVLCTIPQYEQIAVLQKGAAWSKVTYNGETGYVMSRFLSFSNQVVPTQSPVQPSVPTQTPAATNAPVQTPAPQPSYTMDPTLQKLDMVLLAQVNSDGSYLNLRAYCSQDAQVLKQIQQSTYVVITKVGDEWCEVIHEDKLGYCLTKYLKFQVQ
ncbi:MAG: SH3 domain-containing protein [Clostridia bacterium]|nr:SH3 domain-containing protein [Clostridia bacterium]